MESVRTFSVNQLILDWNNDHLTFEKFPEFNFIQPLAQRIAEKGCHCGMGKETADAVARFNEVVLGFDANQIEQIRLRAGGGVKLCFEIHARTYFENKCY